MPLIQLGPYIFSSGYNPQSIQGPNRQLYVVEHEIPAAEGGITEYVGSKQPTYQIAGFLAPVGDTFTGNAGANLSGNGYAALTADTAKDFLIGMRGSGVELLKIESTASNQSGYRNLYENDFFLIERADFAYEAAHTYPYYPYNLQLRRATTKTYGNSSGTGTFPSAAPYFSGYIHILVPNSGFARGETISALGLYAQTVASGNARMALYDVGALKVESASQAVHSGWNYFPVHPTFTTVSGSTYRFAFMGDASSSSGYTLGMEDSAATSGTSFLKSGVAYGTFPSPLGAVLGSVSGIQILMVMVVT